MKSYFPLLLYLLTALGVCAEPVEKVIIAAMKLSEESSYSWRCSVIDDAQSYEVEGKRFNGYTWQRQPMPKTVAKRLGRGAGDELEAIFKDAHNYVIATEDGWRTLRELPKEHEDWQDDQWIYVNTPHSRTPDIPADESSHEPLGLPAAIYMPIISNEAPVKGVYSNVQFALALPHEELSIMVSCHTNICIDRDVASGDLSDIGAQLLLVHDGHEYIKPVVATGRFKLWLLSGSVTKYVVELAGILVVGRKPVYVRQKSTTVLKDVGSTVFALSSEARQRLAAGIPE